MLKHLQLLNYILIDSLDYDVKSGLTAIIGETGAGKSIFLTALLLLLGQRVSHSVVGKFNDYTLIEGVFEFDKNSAEVGKLTQAGFEIEPEYIFSRKIYRDGKSTYRINHQLVNLSFVKELLVNQIDIHSQFHTSQLLDNRYHLTFLDQLLDDNPLLDEVKNKYQLYQQRLKIKNDFEKNNWSIEQLDYLQSEVNELLDFNFSVDDYNQVVGALSQFKEIQSNLKDYQQVLSILEQLNYESLYPTLHLNLENDVLEMLNSCYYQLIEVNEKVNRLINQSDFDEALIEQYNQRLFLYQTNFRKYRVLNVEGLIEKQNELLAFVEDLSDKLKLIQNIDFEIEQKHQDFLAASRQLHEVRKEKAQLLKTEILHHASDLHLKNMQFEVEFKYQESALGIDQIVFMVSMNKGQSLIELSKSASGGELSRFMLILKTIFLNHKHPTVMVFDEIDTGVSGEVASMMGLKIAGLAKKAPVLVVTHLPLVASYADQAYQVIKISNDEQSLVNMVELDRQKFTEQLSMMMTSKVDDLSIQLAEKLVKESNLRKNEL